MHLALLGLTSIYLISWIGMACWAWRRHHRCRLAMRLGVAALAAEDATISREGEPDCQAERVETLGRAIVA